MALYCSLAEFARKLGIEDDRVRYWAQKGWIPYIRMPPSRGKPRQHGYKHARMMVPWRQALRQIRKWDVSPPEVPDDQ